MMVAVTVAVAVGRTMATTAVSIWTIVERMFTHRCFPFFAVVVVNRILNNSPIFQNSIWENAQFSYR
jgi:hypothetical protein